MHKILTVQFRKNVQVPAQRDESIPLRVKGAEGGAAFIRTEHITQLMTQRNTSTKV